MKVQSDSDEYDTHQRALIFHIGKRIKGALSKAGVKGDKLREATEGLTFDIASLLDGSETIKEGRKKIRPFVAFAMDESASKLLVDESGSYMHEYAYGILDELFE
jgi:hypothetical protein